MLKKILNKIQRLEQQKQIKVDKQSQIQVEIDEIDVKLKKLYTFKKDFEKLENNSTEYLNNIKWKIVEKSWLFYLSTLLLI